MADGYISQIKTPDNKVYLLKDSEKTDEKVKQTSNTEDKDFPILFKNANNATEETAGVKYSGNITTDATTTKPFTFNPSTGNLTVTQLKIGTKNDNMGIFPNLNNWNQIGSSALYWYRSYINNYYGGRSHVDNWDSGKNIGTAASSSAAAVLGTVNFYNTAAAGATQTKTLLTADSTTNSNITVTLPKTTGTLALKSELPTLSGLSGIGTISASGTAPLTLSGSKSGTTYTLTGSIADASASASGIVNTDAQTFSGVKTFDNGLHIYGTISTQGTGSAAGTMYPGGAYHSGHNSIILHGDTAGVSGIGFTSEKATKSGTTTNINGSSDRAFIQYHAYGVTPAAEGTAPTLATSGELGALVIGVGNDATDTIRLQAPGTAGILHQIGATAYPIPHTINTNGSVGGTTTPVYVEAGVIKAGTALGTASQKAESYFIKAITSTDNAIVRFDGTSGQVQNSGVTIDDSNIITANASGHSFSNIKFYTHTANAGKTYIGWIKIASIDIGNNNYWGDKIYDIYLDRTYNSPASEVYAIRVCVGWGSSDIIQLGGKYGNQIINKFRIVRNNTTHTAYLEYYVNTDYSTYQNTVNIRAIGYHGAELTLLNEIQTESEDTFASKEEITLSNGIVGNLTGNASTASKLATARNLAVALGSTTSVTFDGSANQTSIPVSGKLAIANGGTNATDAAGARTNLGLGSMAVETATNYLKWQTTTAASTAIYDFGAYCAQNTAAGTGPNGSNYYNIINIPYRKASGNTKADWGWQLGNTTSNDDRMYYRTTGNDAWGAWQTIAHAETSSSNIGSATQPVYMTSAGVITAGTALKALAYKDSLTASDVGAAPAVTGGYLPLSGGTLTGALTTANGTWNTMGDDAYFGDINKAGHIGIKGKNGNTGLFFTTYNQSSNTTGGAITWDGTKFSITSTTAVDASISGNAATATTATTATWVGKGTHTAAITANEFTPAVGTMTILGNVSSTTMAHSNNANAEIIIKAHPTSGTSYYEARLGFSSNGSIYHMPVNTTTWERILTETNTYAASSSDISVAWNTSTTIATINGTAVKIKIPSNPNTNTTYTFAEGSTNGAFSVTPSGGSAQSVPIHGLGALAYKASLSYSDVGAAPSSTVSCTTANVESALGIDFITHSGALNTNGWKTLGGRASGAKIAIAYNNNPASWNSATYSSSLVFGCSDTRGLLDIGYNVPVVTFGGASNANSTDNDPKWYFKLSGTSGQTYTFPAASKTLAASDGSNASGTWGISITGSSASCTGNAATATAIQTAGTTAQFYRGDNTWSNIIKQTANAALGVDTNLKIGTARKDLNFDIGNGSGTGINDGYAGGITWGNGASAYAGIYYQSSGSYGSRLIFGTTGTYANGAYARMIIQNNGNIGIGTLSPDKLLTVNGEIKGTALYLRTAASDPSLTAGARIEFSYPSGQPVVISYTPNDSYRAPAGLKIMGGTSATPAWLEVEGDVYAAAFKGNADTATAANLTSTANAVAYYTNTAGTFGSKASANGALYATSANGALQWGTLPIAQGGTGKTTANDAANILISGLPAWTANPTDDTYLIRRDTGGTATYGQVKFSTVWNYIKGKADSVYANQTTVNGLLAAADAMIFKGTLDGAATSSNGGAGGLTPAANCGDTYKVATIGYINGEPVEVGDIIICTTDSTIASTSSNYSTVKANWVIVQNNVDGAIFKGTNGFTDTHVIIADGTNGKVKDSGFTIASSVPANAKFTDTTSFTITANATDGYWDLTGTNGTNAVTYALTPYSSKQSGANFYTGTANPDGTTRLNYNGYLYATKLYSNGTEVSVSGHTHDYAGSSSAGGAATSANALNFVHTNELLLGNANSQSGIHINHRRVSGGATSGNTAITDYYFKNGNGAITGVTIHAAAFDGSATSAGKWTTARTLTIGNKGQSVDGSGNVSWSLADIGALASTTKYAASSSVGGAATNATTTANTTDSIYPVGVKSGATTTLLHDTSITMKGNAITAVTYNSTAASLTSETSTTANTAKYATLTLGNNANVSTTTAHSEGQIVMYSAATQAHTIKGTSTTTAYTHTLPNDTGLLVSLSGGTAKGSSTKPVYIPNTGIVTECSTYAGGTKVTFNGADKGASTASFYAPTAGGTAGYVLIGAGTTTAPAWYGGTVMSGSAAASWKTAFNGTTDATASNAAAVTIAGGLGIAKSIIVGTTATITNDTRSPKFTLTVNDADKAYLQYNTTDSSIDFIFV